MGYPASRGMNADLHEGMTDGKYKKVVQDRGGIVEGSTWKSRVDLNDRYYGIHEESHKVTGDGKVVVTPNYVETPEPHFF
jgi:hypothetical protein